MTVSACLYVATGLGEEMSGENTSDERETFLQSDRGKPAADLICAQLPERFGLLAVHVLGRRRGYIPASHVVTYLK